MNQPVRIAVAAVLCLLGLQDAAAAGCTPYPADSCNIAVVSQYCPGAGQSCQLRLSESAICDPAGSPLECDAGLACNPMTGSCLPASCTPYPADNCYAASSNAFCPASGQSCQLRLSEGAICDPAGNPLQCVAGLVCNTSTATCTPPGCTPYPADSCNSAVVSQYCPGAGQSCQLRLVEDAACDPTGSPLQCNAGLVCNTSSDTCGLPSADLSETTLGIEPNPVAAGGVLSLSLQAGNAVGSDTATFVQFSESPSNGLLFISIDAPSGWSCTTPAVGQNGPTSCSTGSLAPGTTADFTLSLQPADMLTDGTAESSVDTISSATGDPNHTNNSQTDQIIVFKSIFADGFQ